MYSSKIEGGGGNTIKWQIFEWQRGLKANRTIENDADLDECAFRLWITSRRDHGKQSKMNLTLLDILFVILSEYCILRGQDRCCWITEGVRMTRILVNRFGWKMITSRGEVRLRKVWEWTSENRLGDHRVWGTLSIRSNSHVRANTKIGNSSI